MPSNYPLAVDPARVGEYPAEAKSGGGYFYDEVLDIAFGAALGSAHLMNLMGTFTTTHLIHLRQPKCLLMKLKEQSTRWF